jgi:hypothetical protein
LNQLKKQKPEAAGSRGAVQALRMENDAHVVGPDAPIANSKMVNRTCDPALESANFWFARIRSEPGLPRNARLLWVGPHVELVVVLMSNSKSVLLVKVKCGVNSYNGQRNRF